MSQLNKLSGIAHWLPRLSLAGIFVYHGLGKFPMAEMMAQGMGMPVIMVYMLALMETVGGLLILWGGFGPEWATRVAGLIFSMVMIGAIFMVHWPNGWSFTSGWGEGTNNMGGMEFQVLVVAVSLYYAFKGNAVIEAVTAR
jgi:putative oxidoreductase